MKTPFRTPCLYSLLTTIQLWSILRENEFLRCYETLTTYWSLNIFLFQKVLGVDSQDLAGTMTSIVTHTRGEQVTRHYNKQQSEGKNVTVRFWLLCVFGYLKKIVASFELEFWLSIHFKQYKNLVTIISVVIEPTLAVSQTVFLL